jgi:hypothetical protein
LIYVISDGVFSNLFHLILVVNTSQIEVAKRTVVTGNHYFKLHLVAEYQ